MATKKKKVINFDELIEDKTVYRNTNGYLKHPFRSIVCGSSGSGKTNTVLNLLINKEYKLDYDKVYLYARDLSEEKYQWLIKYYNDLEAKILKKTKEVVKILTYSNKLADIPELETLDKTKQNIMIFDDWTNEPKNKLETISNYFTMCRKFNTSIFFICHSWYACPKMFRMNNEYSFIYRLPSARELRQLYQELGTNIDKDDFKKAYNEATKLSYEFLLIDKKTNIRELMYRHGFDGKFAFLKDDESDSFSE